MQPTRRKLSKRHVRARERPQRHGAKCGVCAKPRRYRKRVIDNILRREARAGGDPHEP
jgi:hypothetical protein